MRQKQAAGACSLSVSATSRTLAARWLTVARTANSKKAEEAAAAQRKKDEAAAELKRSRDDELQRKKQSEELAAPQAAQQQQGRLEAGAMRSQAPEKRNGRVSANA